MSRPPEVRPLADDADVILRAVHVRKSFGAVTALRDVNLFLRRGEVLALVGDNGAGKSTFIKILSGFHQPDGGTIEWEGAPLRLRSPADARALGIETVYQDLALINDLTVYQNMFLGRELEGPIVGPRAAAGQPPDAAGGAGSIWTGLASTFRPWTARWRCCRAGSVSRSRSPARCGALPNS